MTNFNETIRTSSYLNVTLWTGVALSMLFCTPALAQDFSVRVSTNQAYVNQPIQLIVTIGTDQFDAPQLPEIDGCDFESSGPPSVATQISIFNGRRSKSVTTELGYLITPRREGTFVIPELTFIVNGKKRTTEAFEFTAEKSETGDLMEAEIHGMEDEIFVGQSLDVILKIWVKAFRDPERRVTLSANDMFRLMVNQTSWGIFESAITSDSTRIQSELVMKKDASGKPVEYYYFEIPATIYADRPGPVDVGDVKIICDYPISLVTSRDPFDIFGKRLSIGSSRPIEVVTQLSSVVAMDVPNEGKPENYRGAVGKYRITTAATPTEVSVGDPIKLQIAIQGNGRIDLLQAPPLSDIESLTEHFKVSSDPLPGFVRQPQKYFITTVRAKNEGVTEIPSIPFHFFDPDTESYETVFSEPIPIDVSPVESLSLNEFGISKTGNNLGASPDDIDTNGFVGTASATLDFTNDDDAVRAFAESRLPELGNTTSQSKSTIWWCSMLAPPTFWLACIAWLMIPKLRDRLSELQPADVRCRQSLSQAVHSIEIRDALLVYLSNRLDRPFDNESSAIGALRLVGLREEALEVERIFNQLTPLNRDLSQIQDGVFHFDGAKQEALRWLSRIDEVLSDGGTNQRELLLRPGSSGSLKTGVAGFAIAFSLLAGNATSAAQQALVDSNRLNSDQRSELFRSANELYQTAVDQRNQASDDRSDRNSIAVEQNETQEKFLVAARRYQRLIDDGVRSEPVFLNAANAYAQADSIGLALLNYRRVLWLNPNHIQAKNNLRLLSKQVKETIPKTGDSFAKVVSWIGHSNLRWITALGSILFWSLMIAALFLRNRFSIFVVSALPLSIAVVGLWGIYFYPPFEARNPGVVLNSKLEIRDSDGGNALLIPAIEANEGEVVDVMQRRGDWVELRFSNGMAGWTQQKNVGIVVMEAP